jgi:hypothetical protein
MVTIPNGIVGMAPYKDMTDPTYGNRRQWFTYHLQNNEGAPKGALSGVTGGRLEFHANAAVKGGGKITVAQDNREIDWLHRRIKIVMHIEGKDDYPLGVFIPSAPVEKWDDASLIQEIELLDKCSVLDQDYVENAYSLPAGTVVTDAVRDLIVSAGEKAGSITEGGETLSNAMTWEAGTSKLTIINDLLQTANYFSLRADGDGTFRVEKHRPVKDRPIVHSFIDNYKSIFSSEFTYEKDIYSVPNKVILISQGDGDSEGMTAVATNQNPNNRFSYQARGRWITDVTKGVEATDLAALQARAERRLTQLTSPTGTVQINHAPLPWLGPSDKVRFRRREADIDVRAVVVSTQIDLDPTALQRTQLQEVAEL